MGTTQSITVKNFVLIGAAGYIAPRHMQAIKETGNRLLAAVDPHDSVGRLDHYFPDCDFFTEFERFDRHCDKLKRQGTPIHYVVVCSPNYLHDAHIRFGLRIGADVICEKPVVLNPWNVAALMEMEKETGKKVWVVHQLRYHPAIIALKEKVEQAQALQTFKIDLTYITPRGNWYQYSWKGDEQKSGGILSNIGLHFFDMLLWIFGHVIESQVQNYSPTKANGHLQLAKASISWLLSIDKADSVGNTQVDTANRQLTVDGNSIDFSTGFENLHTTSYQQILSGGGITLQESKKVIELVHTLRKNRVPKN
jgi:UDP-N-acetyl-2-amino-2-deoxyglucuronate dehydrogenase